MLFAETANASVTTGATLLTVGLAALSGLFAWLNARETRLGNRDRLNADTQKSQMMTDIAVLKVQVEDCRQDRAEQKVEIAGLRGAMERHGISCPQFHPTPNPAQAGLTPQPK